MRKSDQPRASCSGKQTADNGHTGESGTALAIIDDILSAPVIPPKGTWGGARNHAWLTSQNLTRAKVEELLAAADYAERIGLPFNRHWIVHYEKAGIADPKAARFIGRLLKLARDYARNHKARLAAIWVREGGPEKGGHVHILLHLPADLTLRGHTRRWVRLAGGTCRDGVSRVRAIAGRVSAAESGGEHYAANVGKVRQYLLKGATDDVRAALGLERLPGEQGEIVGKRCGTTRNIGQGARLQRKVN